MKYKSNNEKETRKVATDLAKRLKGGEVVLLYGDLGAGKTVFVKSLAKALGVADVVKSPTFNLMKIYKVPTTYNLQPTTSYLCHIDAYRLKDFNDLLDIGADEYLGKENVISVIEWAERIERKSKKAKKQESKKMALGGKVIKIKIEHGKKENERVIVMNC